MLQELCRLIGSRGEAGYAFLVVQAAIVVVATVATERAIAGRRQGQSRIAGQESARDHFGGAASQFTSMSGSGRQFTGHHYVERRTTHVMRVKTSDAGGRGNPA